MPIEQVLSPALLPIATDDLSSCVESDGVSRTSNGSVSYFNMNWFLSVSMFNLPYQHERLGRLHANDATPMGRTMSQRIQGSRMRTVS